MFKNRLQELAQRHCLSLPEYKSIKDGPDHAPRFKAIVTYNGRTFESPAVCRTAKEAQNAAAEFALDVLLGRADQRPKQTNGPLPVQTQLGVTSSNSNIEAKKEHREDVMPIALANSEMNDGTLQQLHDGSSSSRSGMGSVPVNDQKEDKRLQQPQDRSYSSVSSMVNMLENSKKTDKTLLKPQDGPAASQSLPISRVQRIVPSDGISTSETSRSNVSSRSEISQNGTGKEQVHDIAVSVLERRQWNEETSKQSDSRSSPSQLLSDMHKNQLQDLAFRGGFSLPSYSSVRKGPAHVPLFKAFVTFEGETYESPEFYGTLRQAEHAAAAVALKSLTKKGFSLNESAMYKNFLQEFAQKEGIPFPEYMTDRSGPSHISIFKSTVKFAGLAFVGKEANSKKQAEKNAAMAAWSALKDGRSLSVSTRKTSDNGEKEADHEPNVNIQQSRGHLVSHLNKSLSAFSLTDSPDSEDTDKGKKKELEQNMAASTLTCKDKDTVQQLHSIPLHKQFPSGTTIRVVPQSGPVSGTGPHIRNNTWVAMNITDNAMQNKHNST
uniref:Double-stranded RNA-binding protein 2 n=1 Tax=Pinus taeda TaxID=3352 RepID=A0AAT9XXN2_PINTA